MPEQSLKDKTVKGVAWSGIDNVVQFGITFLVSIVLARLLSPDDYGLIGIITIFTVIGEALVNGGFTTALIRKNDVTENDYNTAFFANLIVSIFLYVVIFIAAPYIALFFHRGELVLLTRVASVALIIGALALVQQTRLTKRIDFKTQTKVTIIAAISSGVIGIGMALLGFGVWSLIAQNISKLFFKAVFLWIYNKWIPKLSFSRKSFNELFGFGWKIMVSGLLDCVWKELYQVVVGRFYSPATLGQYTRAKQFSTLFSSNLTNVIQRVTYPVLSCIQDDRERMISAYRRLIKTSMFITSISMLFLGAISEPLIYCLIGKKWHEAATFLPLICIAGSLYPLHAINLNMLQVQGRSDLFLGLEIVKKTIALIPLSIGAFIGIMPMLYTNLVTGLIAFFLNSHYSGKLLGYSSWMQLKDVSSSYIIAVVMALSVYFWKFIPVSHWVILPIQLLVGTSVFFLICKTTNNQEFVELKNIVVRYIKNIKR